MSTKNSSRFTPVIIAVSVVVGILIGTFYAKHFAGNRLGIINGSSNKLNALLRIVDDQYVDTVNMADLDPIDDVYFLQGDFREQEVADKLAEILNGDKVDVVLSDMAPNLSGIAAADAARSLLLNELALEFCLEHLAPNGVFVTKAFQGSGYSQYVESLKRVFKKVAAKKPEASRDTSAEVYLVSPGLKAPK